MNRPPEVPVDEDEVVIVVDESRPDDPPPGRGRRLVSLAKEASSEAIGVADRYRARRPLRRPPTAVVQTATEIEVAGYEAQRTGAGPACDAILAGAAEAAGQGELGRARSLLTAARVAGVERLERAELVETARSLSTEIRGDEQMTETLERESDRADGGRGSLVALRTATRAGLRRRGAEEVQRVDEAAARASTMLGAARLALLLVVLGAIAAWTGVADADPGDALRNLNNYLSVAAWGAMGVAISLVVPHGRAGPGPAVEQLRPTTELAIRAIVGVTCAVVVVVVLQSGIQEAVDLNEAKAYPFALAAGFGERLVDRRLRLTGEGDAAGNS